FVRIDGESLPILHPQLWPWWLLGLITLIVAEVALAIVASARKRWTTGSAVINTGLAVVFLSWALMLLGRGRLLNPDFLDAVFLDTGVGPDTMGSWASSWPSGSWASPSGTSSTAGSR